MNECYKCQYYSQGFCKANRDLTDDYSTCFRWRDVGADEHGYYTGDGRDKQNRKGYWDWPFLNHH